MQLPEHIEKPMWNTVMHMQEERLAMWYDMWGL